MTNCIQINNISFSRQDAVIFSDFSLNIRRNSITAIMGPSGCGKTTLLHLIGAQLTPTQGSILFYEHDLHKLPRAQLYQVRRKMGLLFQEGALFTDMTIFDNVAFPLRETTHLPESMIRSLVLMKLETVGLRAVHHLFPHQLSGGMKRRAALARTMATDPDVVMYDEPFTGQDPINTSTLLQLIKNLHDLLGITSIIVSHDVPEVLSIADYVYLLSEGGGITQGTPQKLIHHKDPFVQSFIHGATKPNTTFQTNLDDYAKDLLWS